MPFFASPLVGRGRVKAEGGLGDPQSMVSCFHQSMQPELRKPKGGPVSPHEAAGLSRLGEQLRRARLGRGLSQRGLERASGVDQTTISRLENGRLVNLGFLRIVALVEALEGTWEIFPPDPPTPTALLPPPLPSDIAAVDW